MSDTGNMAGGVAVDLFGSADCLFCRLDIYQGSNVIKQVNQWSVYQWSVLKGTSSTLGAKTGQWFTIAHAGSTVYYYTTTLLSSVVGSLSQCYIQLFAFNGNISFDSSLAAFYLNDAQFF